MQKSNQTRKKAATSHSRPDEPERTLKETTTEQPLVADIVITLLRETLGVYVYVAWILNKMTNLDFFCPWMIHTLVHERPLLWVRFEHAPDERSTRPR